MSGIKGYHRPPCKLFYGADTIARITYLAPATVVRLIDKKYIESWKTENGTRQVHWQELVRFLKDYGIWETYPPVSRYLMGLENIDAQNRVDRVRPAGSGHQDDRATRIAS